MPNRNHDKKPISKNDGLSGITAVQERCKKAEKIVIYGAGSYGRKAFDRYCNHHHIVAFIDIDINKANQQLFGITVHTPSDLYRLEFDTIYVASSFSDEIVSRLTVQHGIDRERIFIVPVSELHLQAGIPDIRGQFNSLITLLNTHGIQYWLDHSSLLGLVRDNDACTSDADLAILTSSTEQLIKVITDHFPEGVVSTFTYGFDDLLWRKNDIRQFKFFEALDIHVKIPSGDKIYWLVGPMLLKIESWFYKGFDTLCWQGVNVKAPKRYREYLTALYGDWETPASVWTYSDYNNIGHIFAFNEMQKDLV